MLRRFSMRGSLTDSRAAEALEALAQLRTLSYPVLELTASIWDLRARLSVYDAAYLALARQLDVKLLTLDEGLATMANAEGRLLAL